MEERPIDSLAVCEAHVAEICQCIQVKRVGNQIIGWRCHLATQAKIQGARYARRALTERARAVRNQCSLTLVTVPRLIATQQRPLPHHIDIPRIPLPYPKLC